MTKVLAILLGVLVLSSCGKDPVEPPTPGPSMRYTDLQNTEVKYGTTQRVDVDGNGTIDYSFETLLVGDPILQRDRLQFYADSKIETYLPVNESEQVPVLSSGDTVKAQFPGYTWYDISAIVLAEKISPVNGTPYWDGPWKTAAHQYLPIQVKRGGQRFYGWIELSFDTTAEKLVLHRAAMATVAGKEVKAGS